MKCKAKRPKNRNHMYRRKAVDVILTMLDNIADGLHVWPEVVRSHVMAELPFMATENILMECTFAAGCAALRSMDCFGFGFFVQHDLTPRATRTGVKAGGDRQDLHEKIRVHSMAAGAVVKGQGKPNDLLERIRNDEAFQPVHAKLDQMLDPNLFVGRAPQQVDEYVADVREVLQANEALLKVKNVDSVNV